eukprot:m.230344 g.230344  ORF g.230344 m.230344 type:complete len:51 (-) comp17353_c0_seq20:153-305(-)
MLAVPICSRPSSSATCQESQSIQETQDSVVLDFVLRQASERFARCHKLHG